jgi:arylsulfatase A-like enzyme
MEHPFVRTPAVDRIRNEGANFENMFVTTSLCSPARASFLTGTYAHTHGVTGNHGVDFDPERTPSFPILLQASGYNTAYVGKWHMGRHADPREGFDYWLSFVGQGVHNDPPLNENGREFRETGYMTDILTDYADRWLREKRDPARPFCLCLGHKAVHGPFTPPERDKGLFADVEMAEPPNWQDTFAGKPAWQRAERVGGRNVRRSSRLQEIVPESVPAQPWDPRGAGRLNQLRMIKAIDDGVGRILRTLEELGVLDDTIVIFTSDNGYFHGEHRRGDKRLMYEESLRIPMVLRYPRAVPAGSAVEPMVLNIDVAPTLLDYAGLEPPPGMQGRSFRRLAAGRGDVPWRKSFLYEYWVDLTPAIPHMLGVRTEDWKLVRYPDIDDIDELYDLRNDRYEMRNLAEDPAHAAKLAEMRAELERLKRETDYRPREPVATTTAGELVLAYDFSAAEGGRVPDASGKENHGILTGGRLVAGRRGEALAFDGRAWVEVPNSESLNPARRQWTVEAWVKPAGDGVILARGGASLGYILFVENGKPGFGLRSTRSLVIADGTEPCVGVWTHLAGVLADRKVSLFVNGKRVGVIPAFRMIGSDPNDSMQIGRDAGSPVDETLSPVAFKGLIESVRIHSRALSAEEIAAHARE